MITPPRDCLIILFLLLMGSYTYSQNGERILLGEGFDVRNLNPLNWSEPSLVCQKARAVVSVSPPLNNSSEIKSNPLNKKEIHFIGSAYDFEQQLLKSDTIQNLYLSDYNPVFSQRILDDENRPILVYVQYNKPVYSQKLENIKRTQLDSTFVDWVKKIGTEVSIEGFVHNFGTHYATEVTFGGNFLSRVIITRDEYIYSPYSKEEFKEEVSNYISAAIEDKPYQNEFISIKNFSYFTVGGIASEKKLSKWIQTVNNHPVPIDVSLEPISSLLTSANFPTVSDIDAIRQSLEDFIANAEMEVKSQIKTKEESDYFKKYALQFRQRVLSVVKTLSGGEEDNDSPFTGDLFFGGFLDDQTIINSKPVIERGGIRLKTLITDEKLEINKSIELLVPHKNLKEGFVNVWDESQKLIKGRGRVLLVITGEEANKIYFKDAIRRKVTKEIEVKTIDNDSYYVVYSLEIIKLHDEIFMKNRNQQRDYVMDTEIVAAASTGDLKRIKEFYRKGANKQARGVVRAAIINRQSADFFNVLFDQGVVPTKDDLDLLFDKEYFDAQLALIFLERGAIPKNNMIFKAVSYREPNVIRALLREGAVPVNNDLDFAISLQDIELVSALTGREVSKLEGNKIVYTIEEKIAEDKEEPIIYVVSKGDYLGKIAQNFKVKVVDIKTWNNLTNNTIKINQELHIYPHAPPNDAVAAKKKNKSKAEEKNKLSNPSEVAINLSNSEIISSEEEVSEKELQKIPAPETSIEDDKKVTSEEIIKSEDVISNSTVYIVKNGDYLGKIAKKYGVKVSDIKDWNQLPNIKLQINQELLIYNSLPDKGEKKGKTSEIVLTEEEISEKEVQKMPTPETSIKDDKKVSSEEINNPENVNSNQTVYVVKKGDYLGKIARKYNVKVSDIKEWNELSNNNLKVNQELVILYDANNPEILRQ